MAKILEIQGKRRYLKAQKGFEPWMRRFGETFHEDTSIGDLSDHVLMILIQSGEDASMPLYELVMGIMGLGAGARFYFMDNRDKIAVMDVVIFLLDQLRFEAMRRLGWVEGNEISHVPLVDVIEGFSGHYSRLRHQTPSLSLRHPRYREYEEVFEGDRAAFIRKLIPEAIEVFDKRGSETLEP